MRRASALELVHTDNHRRWAEACRASGQPVTPFHSFPFLDLAAQMTSTVFRPLIVQYAGRDVGVVPWLARRRGPVNMANQLPFPYTGPLVPRELSRECVHALWEHAVRTRAMSLELQFSPQVSLDPEVLVSGFEVRRDQTYIVDTTRDAETLWAGMDRETRRKIRQATRNGVQLVESLDASQVLSQVMHSVFAQHGGSLGYRPLFHLRPSDIDRLGLESHWALATLGDVHLGCLVTLLYEGRALGWVGGVLPEHRATNANLLMYWDAIAWSHDRGASSLDMVGAPSRGIGSFKKQFGGDLVDYLVLKRAVPGWRQMQGGVGRLRHLLHHDDPHHPEPDRSEASDRFVPAHRD